VIELTEDLLSAAEGQEELPRTLCTHLIPPHSILPLSPPPPFPTRSSNSQRTCSVQRSSRRRYSSERVQLQLIPPPSILPHSPPTHQVIELTEDLLSAAEQQTQEEPPPGGDAEAAAVAAPFIPMAFVPATSAAVKRLTAHAYRDPPISTGSCPAFFGVAAINPVAGDSRLLWPEIIPRHSPFLLDDFRNFSGKHIVGALTNRIFSSIVFAPFLLVGPPPVALQLLVGPPPVALHLLVGLPPVAPQRHSAAE
ncbi:unnamed protein product, partial [Closterium sp. NIES-54]